MDFEFALTLISLLDADLAWFEQSDNQMTSEHDRAHFVSLRHNLDALKTTVLIGRVTESRRFAQGVNLNLHGED